MGFLAGGLAAEDYDRSYDDGQLIKRIMAYFRPHMRTRAAGSRRWSCLARWQQR